MSFSVSDSLFPFNYYNSDSYSPSSSTEDRQSSDEMLLDDDDGSLPCNNSTINTSNTPQNQILQSITSISNNSLKRKCPFPSSKQSLKKGRTIKDASKNLAPSISNPSGIFNPELAKHHAYMRLQVAYLQFLALYKTGVRSDGSLYDLEVEIGHARYQNGKGQKENKTHAAHTDAGAGRIDNWTEETKKQVISERQVTPLKKEILKAKGFQEVDFDYFEDPLNSDTEAEKESYFDSLLQKKYEKESLIDGTELMQKVNTTHELPVALNLKCDKALERAIRPHYAALCREVMLGLVNPENATIRYHAIIVEHFEQIIPIIEERVDAVSSYVEALDLFKTNGRTSSTEAIALLLEEMEDYQKQMVKPNPGLAKTALKTHKNFLKLGLQKLDEIPKSSIHTFNKWFTNKYNALKTEASNKLEELKKLLEYNILEKEGSILPPFELMSGSYNQATKRVEPLSSGEMRKQQLRLLSIDPAVQKRLFI